MAEGAGDVPSDDFFANLASENEAMDIPFPTTPLDWDTLLAQQPVDADHMGTTSSTASLPAVSPKASTTAPAGQQGASVSSAAVDWMSLLNKSTQPQLTPGVNSTTGIPSAAAVPIDNVSSGRLGSPVNLSPAGAQDLRASLEWRASLADAPASSSMSPTKKGTAMPRGRSAAGGAKKGAQEGEMSAQKRSRQRQRERMQETARQLEEINAKMEELTIEKQALERRQVALDHVYKAQDEMLELIFANQATRKITQTALLEDMAALISKAVGREITLEEARQWTMRHWVTQHFMSYMKRIAELYSLAARQEGFCESSSNPNAPAQRELHDLVTLREEQGSLVTSYYWGVYSWNVEETKRLNISGPGPQQWRDILVGLRLTNEQTTALINNQRGVAQKLVLIASKRREIVSQLGLELLTVPREEMHRCPSAVNLQRNLAAEQIAVFCFVFSIVDTILTRTQEAILDIRAWPWCADFWQLCNLAAQSQDAPQLPGSEILNALEVGGPALAPIMPHATAFKVLITPITALGTGLRLKRELFFMPGETTAPAAAWPFPSQKLLSAMPLLAVHCALYKTQTWYDWMKRARQGHMEPNALLDVPEP